MNIFVPTASYLSVEEIEYDILKEKGVKCLCFDLDNTLGLYNQKNPTNERINWAQNLINEGFTVIVVSNNHEERVKIFAEDMHCKFLSRAKKPNPNRFLEFLRLNKFSKEEVAMIGDQVITDICMANQAGVVSILIKPISKNELFRTKCNRQMEKILKWLFKISYDKNFSKID